VEGVVAAIGLDIADLFPKQPGRYQRPERRPFSAGDLLSLAAWESLIASLISGDIARGKPDADRERLLQAAGRLLHIAEVANVR
jgi:hypothetical protein